MHSSRKSILILEDEPLVAMMLEEMVAELGHTVAACPRSADEARAAIAASGFDMAVVDVNLWGGTGSELLGQVLELGRPVVISSGYSPAGVPEEFRGLPFIGKPFRIEELDEALGAPATPR
jgi:Response regulator containing CheY-like receiver, AAA-type ATPase, and DNA-binding domains